MVNISVIIPAYNRADLIGETIRSLLAQTLPAFEIIVVDDGSTDNTGQIASSFGSPVRVIRQLNAGPGVARNTGMKASTGEYLHFFDSDDLAAANKHEVQVSALEMTGADIAYGPWLRGRFESNIFEADNLVFQRYGIPEQKNLIKALLTNWSIVPHAALFRRKLVERIGGFPSDLFCSEDQLMFLRCLLSGAKVVHTPETIEFYRVGNDSKLTESNESALLRVKEWARFLLKARHACLESGIEPLQWFGYRRRIWEAKQDLERIDPKQETILSNLRDVSGFLTPDCFYSLHRKVERWRGGLNVRLTGGRANQDFYIGKIHSEQQTMLSLLGYEFREARVKSWRVGAN